MGVYMSSPATKKFSVDKTLKDITYGASCMQGWRIKQEDAHNCLPDFDEDTGTSLFAVYDGHGGAEVAEYCALHLPDYIKNLPEYKAGNIPEALEKAFLGFDATLTQNNVIEELRALAGFDDQEEDEEGEEEETSLLRQEANVPIEEILKRYSDGAPIKAGAIQGLKKREIAESPAIRPNRPKLIPDEDDREGPSSSGDIKQDLGAKLVNGHSENENNENIEREHNQQNINRNDSNTKDDSLPSVSSSSNDMNSSQKGTDARPSSSSDSKPSSSSAGTSSSSKDSNEASVSSSSSCDPGPSGDAGPSRSGDASSSAGGSGSSAGGSGSSSADSHGTSSAGGSGSSSAESSGMSSAGGSGSSSAGGSCSSSSAGGSSTSSSGRRIKPIPVCADDSDDDEDDDSDEEEPDSEELEELLEDDSEDDDLEEEEEEEPHDIDCMLGAGDAREEPGSDSGTTAVLTLLRGRELYVANAGDSRCVVCRAGKAIDMSFDHKPEDEPERQRIVKAGGKVTLDGRVNGGLNLSRAIGDHCYKKNADLPLVDQMITPKPDIKSLTITDEDDFMVIACDGIWNVLTSQETVDFVRQRLKGDIKPSRVIEQLFDHCLAPDTTGDGTGCDNMTAIIVIFNSNGIAATHSSRKRSADGDEEGKEAKKQKTEPEEEKSS